MNPNIILIGASTGGPGHLKKILSSLKPSFNGAIIVAQHMNTTFIPSFIGQFKTELELPVHAIDKKLTLERGHIYICPQHCEMHYEYGTCRVEPVSDGETPYNPSIDTLFHSALNCQEHANILAVLLTGIGHDGAQALSHLQEKGAKCIAESEESAIVYGMPKRAIELNPRIVSKSLDEIISAIKDFGA